MKRMILFLAVNLAAVTLLTGVAAVVCALCGIDLTAALGDGAFSGLFVFSFICQTRRKFSGYTSRPMAILIYHNKHITFTFFPY